MKYWGCLLLFIIYGTFNAFGNGTPEVRIIYLIPSDKEFRQDYKDAIENAIKDVQTWYHNQMGNGKTFRLHIPIVEVFHTAHPASWYSTHPTGEYKDWFWDNVLKDGFKLTGGKFNDPNNIWIFYIDADPACRQLGGAGGGGVALLPANDLRGLVGEQNIPACPDESPDNAGVGRWIGGLAHELGHALGLPHPPECEDKDPSNDDNKCHSLMYHGYRDYPNTFLLPEDRQKLNQSPFFLPITSPRMARLSVLAVPSAVTISSGGYQQVTWRFRETNGVGVTITSRTAIFKSPTGQQLSGVIGPYSNDIHVPGNGMADWTDNVYLPPSVADTARAGGWNSINLEETFYGLDDNNNRVSATAVLIVNVPQEETRIISYLSWGYNIIYSVVPFALNDLKNFGCGQVWLWDWDRKEWVTDFYVPQFQVYWIYVENSCTVRLRGYAPSGRSWDLAGGKWQVITSTKPWDEIAGGCRLLSGPWFLRQVYWDEGRGEWKWDWQSLSTFEKMDGFHAYWVWVESSCYTLDALFYREEASHPLSFFPRLQQPPGGPPSIPEPPGPGPKLTAPIAPSNLRATAVSSSRITLTWQDNSDNEQGFKIERRVEGGSYSQIATVEANTQSYSDSGLSSEATYCYRVRAYNSAGDSPFSDEACATTGAPPSDRGNPPKASFTFSPPEPKVNETVSFTDQSSDPDNDIVSWSWDFGDGTTSTSQSPAHSYSQAGTYTVRLSVRDSKGNWDSTSRSITVGATPRGIYTLIVNIEPPGSGTVAVLLVNDEPYMGSNPQSFPATYTFQQGSVVSLGVTSIALGYEFIGWEGDVTISESIATVVMDRDKMITANFQKRKSPPSIRGEKTIEEALDLNQNHLIDDNEILQAISYWIAGELVPGTDGKIIDDAKILELMDMWIKGTPRPLSLSEAKVKGTNLAVEVSPKLVRNFSIVRFKVEGTGIAEARIQIFTLAGHLVYDSYFIPGNAFEWRPQTKEGQPLANGVYLYVVRVRGFDGREYVSEVRKLVILR
jgi:PKD repeat protein